MLIVSPRALATLLHLISQVRCRDKAELDHGSTRVIPPFAACSRREVEVHGSSIRYGRMTGSEIADEEGWV